ncbi:MAG TPA: DUF3179 domain-containing protein [Thermoleophilaceae bacterium]|nr:DUF3179 domain-containing protein [Thermoleophilaceae bacterium]
MYQRLRSALACAGLALAAAGCGGSGAEPGSDRDRLDRLIGTEASAREALGEITRERDRRFAGPLIELLRANELGLVRTLSGSEIADGLERITGRDGGLDWDAWVEWYASTDIEAPSGFRAWKGGILSRIDSGFGAFFDERLPSEIRVEEVVWGGVALDGIPALDDPATLPAARARYLDEDDPVFGVALGGEARAYPLRILDWHEMVNDTVGGRAVSLAYCTLCGAGVLFATETDERTYTFGSSGFLMRSNKLMYDRQTRTLWNQLTGRPVLGELAGDEVELETLPVVVSTWGRWRERHPDTTVLDIRTGHDRPYSRGAAYGDYFASPEAMFPVGPPGRGLRTKERVFALRVGDAPKAYPLDRVTEERVINDRLGGRGVVVVAAGERIATRGRDERTGVDVEYDSGAEVRAYERGRHRFAGHGSDALRDERGRRWRVTEDALAGPGGERLERLGGHLAYAFGWLSYFPRSEVYGEEG